MHPLITSSLFSSFTRCNGSCALLDSATKLNSDSQTLLHSTMQSMFTLHRLGSLLSTGVFILPDTNTDTDNNTDTDKICLQPNYICSSVGVCQCEHLHTILYNPFLSVSVSVRSILYITLHAFVWDRIRDRLRQCKWTISWMYHHAKTAKTFFCKRIIHLCRWCGWRGWCFRFGTRRLTSSTFLHFRFVLY